MFGSNDEPERTQNCCLTCPADRAARAVSAEEAPGLHALVEELGGQAGLPKPRVAIITSPAPNAFATGRDPKHAVVAVTTGILRSLDRRELGAVLSHELGHVKNRD